VKSGIQDLYQYGKQVQTVVTFEPLNPEPGTDQFRYYMNFTLAKAQALNWLIRFGVPGDLSIFHPRFHKGH
jgi:hypothetical protein